MISVVKKRITQVIREKYPHLSRQFLKTLFRKGQVRLKHRIAKGKEWVQSAKGITIDKKFLKKEIAPNPDVKCRLLFQDDDTIFFEKTSGVSSVCLNFQDTDTAANWLFSVDQNLKKVSTPLESGLLHRLDRETSGVMVAARNKKSFAHLKNLFQKHEVIKDYVCLVENPDIKTGIYRAYARSHPRSKKKVLVKPLHPVRDECQKIVTEIIEKKTCASNKVLLTIRLVTGFRHQIRAHLAFLGAPILGDSLYGGEKAKRLFLHAQRLRLIGPKGKIYDITCPVDMPPKQKITIAHSPDSDDIFMFWALKTKKIEDAEFDFEIVAKDIETLNQLATKARYDITAISMHAYAHLSDKYALLRSGSSFAEKDWGPILVSQKKQTLSDLSKKQIAVPGLWTTAFLLLKLALPDFKPVVMKPEQILPAIRDNKVEAGLLIHEGQIQYKNFGFFLVQNLIETWKKIAGDLPLPLGGSAVKKSLGQTLMKKLSRLQEQSILFAKNHFEEAQAYVQKENPVLSEQELTKYLGWYANDRTVDLGDEGKTALEVLFATAFEKGLIPEKMKIEIV